MPINNSKALLIERSEEFTIAWTNILDVTTSELSEFRIDIKPISEDVVELLRPIEKRAFMPGALFVTAGLGLLIVSLGLCAIDEKDDLRSKLIDKDSDDEGSTKGDSHGSENSDSECD